MAAAIPPNPKQPVNDALALAERGDFSGLPTIIDALGHADPDVRLRAAYAAGRIGSASAIAALERMALRDPVSGNRNQAIYALAAIGRPAVVPMLIAALEDQDAERRQDARVGLYQVLGLEVFEPLADDDDYDREPDAAELARMTAWWNERSARFDPDRVYAFGVLAEPGIFVAQLATATSELPDAHLDALRDWTGRDFGQSPLRKVIAQWTGYWSAEGDQYEPGRRYFYGRPVP